MYAIRSYYDPQKPGTIASAFLALLGGALIAYGYYLSGHMANKQLILNMLLVLFSTILGTYLLFRVTLSWLFYQFRKNKNGHLGLLNSLSLAPLMHRMRANANSLTLITVLSAMTLTMVAMAYSRITSYNVCYTKLLRSRDHPMDMVMAMNMGADDYIQKPFNMDVLSYNFV